MYSVPSIGNAQPGRVIVRFESGSVLPPFGRTQGPVDDFRISPKLRQSLRDNGIERLEKIFPNFKPEDRSSTNSLGERILLEDLSTFYYAEPGPGWTGASMNRLAATRGIRDVSVSKERKLDSVPNDPLFPGQWWLHDTIEPAQDCMGDVVQDADINAPEAWDIHTATGPGASSIRVAILDSGIDPTHEDFDGGVELGPVFAENDLIGPGQCPESYVYSCTPSSLPPDSRDNKGHGTACAGIIAARGNNNLGVAGIAWGITPVSYLVSSPCFGTLMSCWVAHAVDYARTASPPVQILNMSFGSEPYPFEVGPEDPLERAAIRNAFYAGKLLVASMGNNDSNTVHFPASYKGPVFAVGAIANDGQRWSEGNGRGSNYGDWIDIAAPGGDNIVTTKWASLGSLYYDCITGFTGTSAAAPAVSGTAALVLSANPSLVGEDLEEVLSRTARDVGATGWDQYTGAGLVRADAALAFVTAPRLLTHNLSGILSPAGTDRISRTFKGVQGLVDNQPYEVNRHRLQTTITWSPIYELSPDSWVRGSGTLGIQDMAFYDNTREVMGGNVVYVQPGSPTQQGSLTVETYVYEVLQPDSSASIWFPVTPGQARIASTNIFPNTSPAPIHLIGDAVYTNKVSMTWNAPGNDGYVGKAKDYDFRWSLVPITEGNWYSQNQANAGKPANPGTVQSITVKNLQPCTWHYFAIRTIDYEGNISKISNVLHVRTLGCNGAVIFPASLELEPTRDSGNSGPATLKFGIPESQSGRNLELAIYDISGRRVRVLKQGDAQAGRFTETWDMSTNEGRRVGAGVYFVSLRVGASVVSKRLVVLSGPGEE